MKKKGENPFDEVAEAQSAQESVEQTETPDQDHDVPADSDTTTSGLDADRSTSTSTGAADTQDASQTIADESVDGRSLKDSFPAFDYNAAEQEAFYPRAETVASIDDFKYDVEGHLRRAYDVRNVAGRELDDAILSAVLQKMSPEEIAALIVEDRGYSP